jgi:hypothetical protein
MGFFDFFKSSKTPAVAVVARSSSADRDRKEFAADHGLRIGMWVTGDKRTGILTDVNAEGIATVMLTQEDGTNLLQVNTLITGLRQATRAEIPAPRRPDIKPAKLIGYQ